MSPRTQWILALLAALHLERGCEIPGIRQIHEVFYGQHEHISMELSYKNSALGGALRPS